MFRGCPFAQLAPMFFNEVLIQLGNFPQDQMNTFDPRRVLNSLKCLLQNNLCGFEFSHVDRNTEWRQYNCRQNQNSIVTPAVVLLV